MIRVVKEVLEANAYFCINFCFSFIRNEKKKCRATPASTHMLMLAKTTKSHKLYNCSLPQHCCALLLLFFAGYIFHAFFSYTQTYLKTIKSHVYVQFNLHVLQSMNKKIIIHMVKICSTLLRMVSKKKKK